MLKKNIKFVDYNGNEREENHYFNLNDAELIEMQLTKEGGLTDYILKIIETQDIPTLVKLFTELIKKSYGVKSDDGKRFMKSPEITKAFVETEAYVVLYKELISDAKKAADFVKAIVPAELARKSDEELKNNPKLSKIVGNTINASENKQENNTVTVQ